MLANNVDPDQTPRYVAPDLGLHCLVMSKPLSRVFGPPVTHACPEVINFFHALLS